MARASPQTQAKRQRERDKAEKREDKEARRVVRRKLAADEAAGRGPTSGSAARDDPGTTER